MDSFKSRVNFCLLRSSLGIHLFRDCHFLCYRFIHTMWLCVITSMWCYRFIHTILMIDALLHTCPTSRHVASTSWCKCKWTLASSLPPHHPISCLACHMCASANERHHPHPTPPHHPISCVACHMCASANERHHPHPTPPHHPISCVACHMCASANERHHPHPTPPPTLTSRSINFMSYEHHAYDLIRATTKTCKFHGAVPTSWAKTTTLGTSWKKGSKVMTGNLQFRRC